MKSNAHCQEMESETHLVSSRSKKTGLIWFKEVNTMAAASPAKNLQDEAICSICLDYFQDPVMIVDCGHNFCRACITQYGKGYNTNGCCPQCRERFSWQNLKSNRHLGRMVEAVKQFSLQLGSPGERMCVVHKKALSLFCKKDKILICVVCARTGTHQDHPVVATKEAAADYKVIVTLLPQGDKGIRGSPATGTAHCKGIIPSQAIVPTKGWN